MWLPEYLDVQGNALLKLIEEPPAKTLFLLVAENQDKILNTIISRTQLVKIFKLGHQDVKSFLIADKGLSEERAHEIAFIADGNIQTAIDLLEEDTNPYFNLLINWLRFVVTDAGLQLIRTSEEDLSKLGRENQKKFPNLCHQYVAPNCALTTRASRFGPHTGTRIRLCQEV